MDANAYANDDDDENGQRERDVEWHRKEEGKKGRGEREMDAEPLWLFVWATAVSAVPSLAITRLSLMAEMAA